MNTLTFEKSKEMITKKGMENLEKVNNLLNEYDTKYDEYNEELNKIGRILGYLNSKKQSLTNSLNYAGVIVENKKGISNINGFVRDFRKLLNLKKDSKIKNWSGYVVYKQEYCDNGRIDYYRTEKVNAFHFTIDGKNYTNENTDLISLIEKYNIYSIQFKTLEIDCWGAVDNTYYTSVKVNENSEAVYLKDLIGNVEDDFCPVHYGKLYEKLLNDTYYEKVLKDIETDCFHYDHEED